MRATVITVTETLGEESFALSAHYVQDTGHHSIWIKMDRKKVHNPSVNIEMSIEEAEELCKSLNEAILLGKKCREADREFLKEVFKIEKKPCTCKWTELK